MKFKADFCLAAALMCALVFPVAGIVSAAAPVTSVARPQGPCDIYQTAGTPCVAAHGTTRALYAAIKARFTRCCASRTARH